ncbi:MAG: hypothetical protein MUO26_05355 [Methanotrichaceae archaeon]|nr:hypothetical protein [Methanotrichaceae archaeon]
MALINNLKDHGQFADAKDCYYVYRKQHKNGLLDNLSWIFCGFGVRPEFTLVWAVLFVGFFGIVYQVSKCTHESECPFRPIGSKTSSSNQSIVKSLYYSTLVFFHTHPPAYWHPAGRWKYVVVFEDILGWFLLALFVVVLVNVMITW